MSLMRPSGDRQTKYAMCNISALVENTKTRHLVHTLPTGSIFLVTLYDLILACYHPKENTVVRPQIFHADG